MDEKTRVKMLEEYGLYTCELDGDEEECMSPRQITDEITAINMINNDIEILSDLRERLLEYKRARDRQKELV